VRQWAVAVIKELLSKHAMRITVMVVGLFIIIGVFGYLTGQGHPTTGFTADLKYFGQLGAPTAAALSSLWKAYDNHRRLDDANDKLEVVRKQTNGVVTKQQEIVQETLPPVVDSVQALEEQITKLTKTVDEMRAETKNAD
jgi:hypothetical protein